jgi:hypothetical protein
MTGGGRVPVPDFTPKLLDAIRLAREAGLTHSATELEERSFAAYTTSSEWLGVVGEAILRFRSREGKRVPAGVEARLDECQREIGKVWPRYKPGPLRGFLRELGRMWPR